MPERAEGPIHHDPEVLVKITKSPPKPWEDTVWSARTWAHMREQYSGYIQGWGISTFPEFRGTPYEVDIPVRRRFVRPEITAELEGITAERLQTEPFQDFYRHVDMMISFDQHKTVRDNIELIVRRSRAERSDFAQAVEPSHERGAEIVRDWLEAQVYFRTLACLEMCEEDAEFRIPSDVVRTLYDDALGYQPEFLRPALEFDKRNKMYGESIDVEERFKEYFMPKILSDDEGEREEAEQFVSWRTAYSEFFSSLFIYSLIHATSQDQRERIVQTFAPTMGLEKVRRSLKDYADANENFGGTLKDMMTYLSVEPAQAKVEGDIDMYDQINFGEYRPNDEILDFEVDLLKSEFGEGINVLDVACGTGRHLLNLDGEDGRSVTGVDLVKKHVESVLAQKPDADVKEGSWYELPFEDKQFSGAYCLGRSFAHNRTVPDAVQCLMEIGRVTTDDATIIIDLPDPTKGDYAHHVRDTYALARKLGLKKVLPGVINDSPDNEHYFDRYVPSDNAIKGIAWLAGYKVEKIGVQPYHGISGEENQNQYWRLTKFPTKRKIPGYEILQCFNDIYGFPNLPGVPMPDRTMLAW